MMKLKYIPLVAALAILPIWMAFVFLVNPVIGVAPESGAVVTSEEYTIITDDGYCSVVTRDAYGYVAESVYHSDDLDDCINWLRDHYQNG